MIVNEYSLIKVINTFSFGKIYLGSKIGSQANYAIRKIKLKTYLKKKI